MKKSIEFSVKKTGTFLLFLALLCSIVITGLSVNLVSAQTVSSITIMSDGSVKGTDLIQRDGNIYVFTGDLFGTITVEKDGIIIDGAGYAIKGNGNGIDLRKDPSSTVAIPSCYGDVVVKNVRFCDKGHIVASSGGNSFINNIFEGGGIKIKGGSGDEGDVIKYNVFIGGRPALEADYSGKVVVAENDFVNCRILLFLYGGLEFDRNYWSDYEILCPDAKEKGVTGIWDTPYRYDKADWSDCSFMDDNPLVNPTNGAGAPPGVNEKPTPTVPTTFTGGDESVFPSIALIIAVSIVSVVIVISLLVYFKKHK